MFIKTLSVKYDRIDVYKGIDVSKTNGSREWIICHYWYFLVINFRFQPKVSNGCHNLMQTAVVFLMMLQFFLLKEMITEFVFGIQARMKP